MKNPQPTQTVREPDPNGHETVRPVTALARDERETIIRLSDGDDTVHIDTTRRADITALRKKPDATETGSGFHGSTEWATFAIPRSRWSTARGIKSAPRTLTPEQREAAAERLRQYRKGK